MWLFIGTNGSGKSTLAKHFNVLLQPTAGNVTVCGFDTLNDEHIWNIRQHVGMVFQNPDNQIVAAVVEEDVAFGPENLGVPSAEIRKRVDDCFGCSKHDRICGTWSAFIIWRSKSNGLPLLVYLL